VSDRSAEIVTGADHPDGTSPVDVVCTRPDLARGVLNAIGNAFTDECECLIPDERLREAVDALSILVCEARAAMKFMLNVKAPHIQSAFVRPGGEK
jgi:hypothetical protein